MKIKFIRPSGSFFPVGILQILVLHGSKLVIRRADGAILNEFLQSIAF